MRAALCLILLAALWAWPAPAAQPAPAPKPSTEAADLERPVAVEGARKVPLKLLEAVAIGLTRNIDLKKALLDRASQIGDLQLAERMFEPQPYLSAFYRHSSTGNQDTRGGGVEIITQLMTAGALTFNWDVSNTLHRGSGEDAHSSVVRLALNQPLLRGGGLTVGTAELVSARYNETSNQESFRSTIMNQITTIQTTYWNLLLALQNRLSTVRSLEASKELLKRNKVLIKAGRMAAADLVQTEQEVARAKVSILEQDFAVQAANRSLLNLLDLGSEVEILPVEGFTFSKVEVDYKNLYQTALARNPSWKQSQVSLKQAELDLKLAQNRAKDVLDLELSTSTTPREESLAEDTLDMGRDWLVGLSLKVPLGLPRDRLRHEVTKAARTLEKARMELHRAKLNLSQSVRTGVNDVRRSLLQIRMAQDSRRLALRKYEIERNRLELGRSSNFQVLSYQRDLVSATDSENQAIVSYLNSLASLEETVGVTLDTWKVKIENPLPPKIPSLTLGAEKRPH